MAALNSRQPARMAAFYAPEAMRVRADQTIQGLAAIQIDYDAFFNSLPIGSTFNLVNVDIQGVVRYLTWEAGGLTGLTTLVVEGGKITLDYTLIG
jgi:ketosteroid isomerase-like protein